MLKKLNRKCLGRCLLLACCLTASESILARDAVGSQEATVSTVAKAASSLMLDMVKAGASRLVAVGERGHILFSDDQGLTWQRAEVPSQATLTGVYFVDDSDGWAVGHDATILMTRDGGKSWQLQASDPGAEKPFLDVWFSNKRVGLAVGAYGLMKRTDDGGQTWNTVDTSSLGDDLIAEPHLNALYALGNGQLLLVGEAGLVARSEDAGRTWKRLNSPYDGSFFGVGQTPGKALLIAGLRGHLYRSVDGGNSWQLVETGTVSALNAVVSSPEGVYVFGNDGVVLRSQDDGRRFVKVQRGDRKGIAAGVAVATGFVLAGEAGIKRVGPAGNDLKE